MAGLISFSTTGNQTPSPGIVNDWLSGLPTPNTGNVKASAISGNPTPYPDSVKGEIRCKMYQGYV